MSCTKIGDLVEGRSHFRGQDLFIMVLVGSHTQRSIKVLFKHVFRVKGHVDLLQEQLDWHFGIY